MGEALIWIGGLVVFLALLHFVASWAERRGWMSLTNRGSRLAVEPLLP